MLSPEKWGGQKPLAEVAFSELSNHRCGWNTVRLLARNHCMWILGEVSPRWLGLPWTRRHVFEALVYFFGYCFWSYFTCGLQKCTYFARYQLMWQSRSRLWKDPNHLVRVHLAAGLTADSASQHTTQNQSQLCLPLCSSGWQSWHCPPMWTENWAITPFSREGKLQQWIKLFFL